jgi:hypothetical protein
LKPSQLLGGHDRTDKSFQFTADFLAAIFTWGGIGWLVDQALGTTPLVMVLGFIVGNMSGIYLLYIRSRDGESMSDDVARPDDEKSPAGPQMVDGPGGHDPLPPGPRKVTTHDATE